jgi:hypothetical protein
MLGGGCRYQQAGDSAAAPAPSFGELLGGSAVAHRLDRAPGRHRWASVCTPRRRRYTSEGSTNNNRFLCRFKPGKKRRIFSADNSDFSDGFLYGPSKRAIRAP